MTIEEQSYVYGLLGKDGSLYLQDRNRGRVTLEVSERDADIVEKLCLLIPNSTISRRERSTNFSEYYKTNAFCNYHIEFREWLIALGYPTEDKSNRFTVPKGEYSERDFWRGVIGADGSIGYIADGSPFLSLVIVGEKLKEEYVKLLSKFGITKIIKRNKRDGVYNVVLKNEDAQSVAEYLYGGSNLYIQRKYNSYKEVMKWKRKKRKISSNGFTLEEREFIYTHSVEESVKFTGRTEKSIKSVLYRDGRKNAIGDTVAIVSHISPVYNFKASE